MKRLWRKSGGSCEFPALVWRLADDLNVGTHTDLYDLVACVLLGPSIVARSIKLD